jgi:Flp pilus assembly protein TadG
VSLLILQKAVRQKPSRKGALTVETALVLPVLGILLAGLMEFGHYFLVSNTLNAAAREGVQIGCYEEVTSAQVETKVRQIVAAALNSNQATVSVRDGSVFDTANVNPSSINFNSLPLMEVSTCKRGDCFIAQVSVPYNSVALLPPFWLKNKTIVGRAVMRHE